MYLNNVSENFIAFYRGSENNVFMAGSYGNCVCLTCGTCVCR
jgi:hypothetical protein